MTQDEYNSLQPNARVRLDVDLVMLPGKVVPSRHYGTYGFCWWAVVVKEGRGEYHYTPTSVEAFLRDVELFREPED